MAKYESPPDRDEDGELSDQRHNRYIKRYGVGFTSSLLHYPGETTRGSVRRHSL